MGGRCAVGAAVAVWVGLLLGPALSPLALKLSLALVPPLGWLALRGPDRVGTIALMIALCLAGAGRGAGHAARIDRARAAIEAERLVRLDAVVVAPPERESGEPVARVEVRAAEPPMPAGMRARLRFPAGTPIEWGDRFTALARLEVPARIRNPGGYDARAAADANQIAAVGKVFTAEVSAPSWPAAGLRATVVRWRRAIDRRLESSLDPATRELVVPLVVGDRSAVSPELNARLRAAGLIHLLALSGLHVAWMVAIARGVAAAAGGGVRARAMAGALCAAAYVGIAGPLPSLMRAAVTELFHSAARFSGRAFDPVQGLALSALALLTAAPGWAADLGFQLSCAATLGLVTIGPALSGDRWRALRLAFAPTASAQVTAMPLLLHHFNVVSWIAPLANLVAVPISGLLLTAAWAAVLIDGLAPGGARPWFAACEALGAAFRGVTEASTSFPGALLPAGAAIAPVALSTTSAVLLAFACPPPRSLLERARPVSARRAGALALGVWAGALALLLAATPRPLRPAAGKVWLVALDVGQGDAIALGFEDGWWLIDTGPRSPHYDAGESVVLPFLRWAGVRELHTMVLTHDDGDHTGGAPAVRRGVSIGRLLAACAQPGAPGPSARFGAEPVAAGAVLRHDPSVRVLWPPRPEAQTADGSPIASDNAASLVLEVMASRTRLLMLADVDSAVEDRLPISGPVSVLKVAHHGSASSSGARFLDRIRPRVAVVSCGRRNPFGHPAPRVIERLRACGASIARTDSSGALWFEAGPEGLRAIDWRSGPPRTPSARSRDPAMRPRAP